MRDLLTIYRDILRRSRDRRELAANLLVVAVLGATLLAVLPLCWCWPERE